MKRNSFLSIIIPCRNERSYVHECLRSIIENDYPHDRLEVLFVDAMSEDGTRDLVKRYCGRYSFVMLLDNPSKITPTAMNIGIEHAQGEYVIMLSCHSRLHRNFIMANVSNLVKHRVGCVGGSMITLPGKNTLTARAIAHTLSHPFGVGNAYFRTGRCHPKIVDTVPFGCYQKEVFKKVGGIDENLLRNQDIEFNLRLRKFGYRILLIPEIISYYYARPNLKGLFIQNFGNGFWVTFGLNYSRLTFSFRHLVPLALVAMLCINLMLSPLLTLSFYVFLLSLSSYFLTNLFFSFSCSLRNGIYYFPLLVASFFTLHFSYGMGSLFGLVKLTLSKLKRR